MDLDIKNVRSFFDRYRGLETPAAKVLSPDEFMTLFSQLRESYQVLKRETADHVLRDAPAFNIFNILRLSRSEVRTHSAFLGHLLSPSASQRPARFL